VSAAEGVRVRGLGPYEEQRRYLFEQIARALGDEWVERNERLAHEYWNAVVALGYALPDERHTNREEAA
jgi:hypothetical protein